MSITWYQVWLVLSKNGEQVPGGVPDKGDNWLQGVPGKSGDQLSERYMVIAVNGWEEGLI